MCAQTAWQSLKMSGISLPRNLVVTTVFVVDDGTTRLRAIHVVANADVRIPRRGGRLQRLFTSS